MAADTPADTVTTDAPDYRDTVFLPETGFPMRAGLPQRAQHAYQSSDWLFCLRLTSFYVPVYPTTARCLACPLHSIGTWAIIHAVSGPHLLSTSDLSDGHFRAC